MRQGARAFVVSLVFGWLAVAATGHAQSVPTPRAGGDLTGSHPQEFVIGLLLPPTETEARSIQKGAELGVAQANAEFSTRARLVVRGQPGQWGTDGDEAARLVFEDHAQGLIAPPGGASSHLLLQVAGRTRVPVVDLCPDSSVTGAGLPWMVRVVPGARDQAEALFTQVRARDGQPALRWSALVPAGRAGREARRDLETAATTARANLLSVSEVPDDNAPAPAKLREWLTQSPDGVVLWLEPAVAARCARALRENQFSGRLAGPGALQTAAFLQAAGGAVNGFLVPVVSEDVTTQKLAAQFAENFRTRHGTEPEPAAAFAFDAVRLLAWRLNAGDPTDGRSLAKLMLPGATGTLRFDAQGNRLVTLRARAYRGGRFTELKQP